MKKIYFIVSLAVLALLTSCQDFNSDNFPGFEQAAKPSNIVNYEYTLIGGDYNAISTQILNSAITPTDSAKAKAIGTNKYFVDSVQFKAGISSYLISKYVYADTNSIAKVSFKYFVPFDTITVVPDKYELVAIDYASMGLTTNLTLSASPSRYLPIWLKTKYPYANPNNIKLIRYLYNDGATTIKTYKIFIYDGTIWNEYNTVKLVSAKFILKATGWTFIRSEVFSESFNTSLGLFTSHQISGTKYDWIWSSKGVAKGTGYAVENAYNKGALEVWLVSPEIILPNNTNLSFSFYHAINYFTGAMTLSDLTSVYISTDYSDDVQSATWNKLDIAYPSAPSFSFINSGDISLKDYANNKIHIGFKYVSTGTAVAWEIKNLSIIEK